MSLKSFLMPTVDGIISKFLSVIAELEAHEKALEARAKAKFEAAREAMNEGNLINDERIRAGEIAAKMRELFNVH